ncbi:MAG: 50S ribosomal protein L21 [Clostridiales bacterium]|nr:50S ribosomal protein L21 [Candidatus Apopatousia equi]
MYAVVLVGGKQYKVSEGETFEVERLSSEVGTTVNLDVLMLVDGKTVKVGKPLVEGAEVVAEVVNHGKADKILVSRYKAKKHTKKQQGHRQPFTTLKIVSVK